jgi:hypothetical protein
MSCQFLPGADGGMVRPTGFEPVACGSGGRRSIQLSYGRIRGPRILAPAQRIATSVSVRHSEGEGSCPNPTANDPARVRDHDERAAGTSPIARWLAVPILRGPTPLASSGPAPESEPFPGPDPTSRPPNPGIPLSLTDFSACPYH